MLLIAIAGGSGSGKTTFAKRLLAGNQNCVSLLHLDSYYLPKIPNKLSINGKTNYDHPDSFDWNLINEHLNKLRDGESIESPHYCFKTNCRLSESTKINASNVIVVEGIFALHNNKVRQTSNIKCFMHVDSDIRFSRRLHRDLYERGRTIESITHQYYETVRPMHIKYIEPQKHHADLIIGENTDIAADILSSKIESSFRQQFSIIKSESKFLHS